MTWDNAQAHTSYIILHVAPNYNTILFAKWGKRMHGYMLDPIPLLVIEIIASMQVSSYALQCETGH